MTVQPSVWPPIPTGSLIIISSGIPHLVFLKESFRADTLYGTLPQKMTGDEDSRIKHKSGRHKYDDHSVVVLLLS